MDAPAPFTMHVPLDRVTGLAIESGVQFVLRGTVSVALDGASFDAAALFDFAAGGLRVVDSDAAHGAYVLAANGGTAAACTAAGSPSPCLVPRLAELAHARLRTASELASTLSGSIVLESQASGAGEGEGFGAVGGLAMVLALIGLAWAAIVGVRRFARSSMRRVRVAARRALRATRGDETLDPVRPKIVLLVARAQDLDRIRRDCGRKLRRADRAALSAERAEVGRLESERAAAGLEIERIVSALRLVALRAGTSGSAALPPGVDPVDALVAELDFREQALLEAGVR
jgi:hypothetical protein